jgi:ribosomal protein L11 methyltransferase
MFLNLKWFNQPPLLYSARKELLNWAKKGEVFSLFSDGDEVLFESLNDQELTAPELDRLEKSIDLAAKGIGFGGFICGKNLCEPGGYCYFKLDLIANEARLDILIITSRYEAEKVLQSPLLHLGLMELGFEHNSIEQIFLPLIKITQSDSFSLKIPGLLAAHGQGWWYRPHKLNVSTDYFAEEPLQSELKWLEISMPVEPGLDKYINRIFTSYSYHERVLTQRAAVKEPDDSESGDLTKPANISMYLPHNKIGEKALKDLREWLRDINVFHPISRPLVKILSGQEWSKLWEEFNIFRIGKHFLVREADLHYPLKPGDLNIDLLVTPSAFSTHLLGLHPSTHVVLEQFEDFIDPVKHKNALDMGCGAGILSIAAARMGVKQILALDADPAAVRACRMNAGYNGLQDRIRVEQGSLAPFVSAEKDKIYNFEVEFLQPPPVIDERCPFDVIFCNTYPHVLVNLSEKFNMALNNDGLLFSSGIEKHRVMEVTDVLEKTGFIEIDRREVDNWVGLVHRKL